MILQPKSEKGVHNNCETTCKPAVSPDWNLVLSFLRLSRSSLVTDWTFKPSINKTPLILKEHTNVIRTLLPTCTIKNNAQEPWVQREFSWKNWWWKALEESSCASWERREPGETGRQDIARGACKKILWKRTGGSGVRTLYESNLERMSLTGSGLEQIHAVNPANGELWRQQPEADLWCRGEWMPGLDLMNRIFSRQHDGHAELF